ncbi:MULTISPECIES: site-specific integrase [unclassified Rhodococcus (in: high G+C Gram-positive bacteria)]|uniref:site-specific integrase n=1 Tax=unclassified Rhodococcus (in: high G+C Gram-positive bacteria) TaxID=192944 RepID=UPI0007BB957D|nr:MULTISPECIES: site-specific integrase [unclassified Rhodococcus (in: high G+C Gram-positive bacteria)]KZF03720.1 integrase [Rhodococcus sp. EPR-147]KZF05940.1 integrase [Rhodococcus sp. EPR-279]OZC60511.1 integrase [Rhodococcus sp. 06-469-3-2]OZC73791.1 integrase [Rhodococcus sp. 06-418-5]OZE07328.1 integrase [Rhodococcus sp. 05-2255-3B1]
MDSRPGRAPSVTTGVGIPAGVGSVAVEPEIPPAVAKRIASAVQSSRSEGTRKTYAAAWRRFTKWCEANGHVTLPAHPITVAAYLVDAADTRTESGERAYAVATFGTWTAAINHQHRTTGHLSPSAHELVTATLSGIRREYAAAGDRPRTPRDPLLVDDIKLLVRTARERCRGWADEVLERRDSAILLLGFAGAFRRSELSELACGDVSVHRHDGLHVRMRKSKTDQEGRGAVKALPYTGSHETCPPCAYVRWAQVVAAFDAGGRASVIRLLRKRESFAGHVCRGGVPRTAARAPLFRAIAKNGNLGNTPLSGAAIHRTIRRRAEHAGYDATALTKLGGHSLRAGFVTQGTRNGADGSAIARQTGHASLDSVEVYRREHAPLVGNAVADIGL